jgi:transposase
MEPSSNRWDASRGGATHQDLSDEEEDDDGADYEQTTLGQTIVRDRDGTAHALMYSSRVGFDFTAPIEGAGGPGNAELMEVIESQKRDIRYLTEKVERLEKERQDMVDNFKLSSSVLLERLKDLEAEQAAILGGERPQTANVLSKISKCHRLITLVKDAESQGRRIGASSKPP